MSFPNRRLTLISTVAMMAIGISFGTAFAQSERDLTVVQSQVLQVAKPIPSSLTVTTLLDRADATYAVGENVHLGVKTNEDAYVTVLSIGPTGKVTRLFPNAFQPNNAVKAGETLEIPAASSGAKITVGGPVGAELIKVIATSSPVSIVPEAQLQGSGTFKSLQGDVDGLVRDLSVVATTPSANTKVAITNRIIKTIAARTASGTGTSVLGAVAQPAATPETFPLLLASDKQSYKVGETLTIAATATKACFLTVIAASSSGQVRMIFPSIAFPNNHLNAGQTVIMSGGGAPQSVVAIGPSLETVTALCTVDPRVSGAVKSATDVISADEKSAFDRDLALVGARQGTTGYAQLSLKLVP